MKKIPKLRFSKFNGVDFPQSFEPEINIDENGLSNSFLSDLASNLIQSRNVQKLVSDEIANFRESINHITIISSSEEQDYFTNFFIFRILDNLQDFVRSDPIFTELKQELEKYRSLVNGLGDSGNGNETSEDEVKENEFINQATKLGLQGKARDDYVKTCIIKWQNQKREQAASEAKLLGTAMQQLLPDIFEEKRAIPNVFLRGALFGMVRKGKRALVGNKPIFTMSQYEVFFTGFELDQNDLEVWDTLMYLAKDRQVESELRMSLYELCQQLGLADQKINRENIFNRAKRLQGGQVFIKAHDKRYVGSLIDEVFIDDTDGKIVIRYNKRLAPLFSGADYTLISTDIRHLLGDNQLARWLYNFYESHNDPIPFSIDFLQKLCRSESQPKEFKRLLKTALDLVKRAHLAVNHKSKWDFEITRNNFLLVNPNGQNRKKKQIDLFNGA